MQNPPAICLISPSHPCSNPRLVKEADALVEAGYRVHVITSRYMPALDRFDEDIYRQAKWTFSRVDQTAFLRRARHALLRRLARRVRPVAKRWPLLLHYPAAMDLIGPAKAFRANLYIAHVLAGLPIACAAAKANGAKVGFDAEDYHSGEIAESADSANDIAARREIEGLMRFCTHRTAASPLIAARYEQERGLSFATILNTFPISMFPERQPDRPSEDGRIRLYWFSQTIGPDRGLEETAEILNLLKTPVSLALRGHAQPEFVERLRSICRFPVHILPPEDPSLMAQCFAEHDAGLAVERNTPVNRDLCLTNKLFVSLLAGRPLILSKTSAQVEFAREAGEAAAVIDFERAEESAAMLDGWLGNPERLRKATDHAWSLGRNRYNWDIEKAKLLAAVEASLRS